MSYNIPEELKPLTAGYLERRDQDIEQLKVFAKNDDFESVEHLAHKLKGNGASYGFQKISDLGEELTQASKDKNTAAIFRLTADLSSEVSFIRQQVLQQ
jgi:HPt (histidine-containing phosphotransfer) domain-containing protein